MKKRYWFTKVYRCDKQLVMAGFASILFFCTILYVCSCTQNNRAIEETFPGINKNEESGVVSLRVEDTCGAIARIRLTDEEIKNRYEYLLFFQQKEFPASLIPFYPDVRWELPPVKQFSMARLYIGKETTEDRNDYLLISIFSNNPADSCCCTNPFAIQGEGFVSRIDNDIKLKCGVAVYSKHQRWLSKENINTLIANYIDFMKKHRLLADEYPQSFSLLNNRGNFLNNPRQLIPLLPQNTVIESCSKKLHSSDYYEAEKKFNVLVVPALEKKEKEISDCCQAPPMGYATAAPLR